MGGFVDFGRKKLKTNGRGRKIKKDNQLTFHFSYVNNQIFKIYPNLEKYLNPFNFPYFIVLYSIYTTPLKAHPFLLPTP